MIKNVGILTLPLIDNYGGIIQLCALYKAIEFLGHKPVVIIKKRDISFTKHLKYILLNKNPLYPFAIANKFTVNHKNLKDVDQFLQKFLTNSTSVIYSQKQLDRYGDRFDAYIVGSDQVWRYAYTKDDYTNYFLDFVSTDKIKLSYGASFGIDTWEGDGESQVVVTKLLKRFQAISVREFSALPLLDKTMDVKEAQHVLDPTLLFDRDFYDNIIAQNKLSVPCIQDGLFNYVLDQSQQYKNIVEDLCNQHNLALGTISLDTKAEVNIVQWLKHFSSAQYIITDSFHGMVFSIIYKKKFIAIGNKQRGLDRFMSLLTLLGLTNRLVSSAEQVCFSLLDQDIDYEGVQHLLEQQRSISLNFLKKNLASLTQG